jgi:hypothetical protein
MFVYLLIAAELALLWVVFWYIYVREPRHRSHISPHMWGGYHGPADEPYVDPYLSYLESQRDLDATTRTYAQAPEFIWDSRVNRYVPVSQYEAQNFLARMAAKLDRQLSELNVRP